MIIKKKGSFEAAHMLSNYNGACGNLHGHSYTYELELHGVTGNHDMVMDFTIIKGAIDAFDHALLISAPDSRDEAEGELLIWAQKWKKKIVLMHEGRPTAEKIAQQIAKAFLTFSVGKINKVVCRLKETGSSEVEVTEEWN